MKNVAIIIRLIFAITFLVSAISKLINPGLVEIILIDQGIVESRLIAGYIVRVFIAVEFSIGLLFLLPYYLKRITIPVTWFLLLFFTTYLVYSGFILGDKENCGCFGELFEMSPIESIVKNIVIAVFSILLFKIVKEEKSKLFIPITITVLSLAIIFIGFPVREVNNFRFGKYMYFEGKGRTDLTSGDKLLAVFSLDCEHCQEAAKELSELKVQNHRLPEIFVLFFSEGRESVDSFNEITKSNFPYTMIDAGEFFDLIGTSPPRIYWLKDGQIKKYWDDQIIENIATEVKK